MGLPIPIAAVTVATCYLFIRETGIDVKDNYIFLALVPIVSFLMVSGVNYKSYKKAQDTVRKDFFANMVIFLLLLVVVAVHPDLMLFLLAIIYIVHGLLLDSYNRIRSMIVSKKVKRVARLKDKGSVTL